MDIARTKHWIFKHETIATNKESDLCGSLSLKHCS